MVRQQPDGAFGAHAAETRLDGEAHLPCLERLSNGRQLGRRCRASTVDQEAPRPPAAVGADCSTTLP